jgi:hypothetical protein
LNVKITVTLSFNSLPLDGEIHFFIDENYWKTVTTTDGYYEEITDVTGKQLKVVYNGTNSYDASYDIKPLPSVPPKVTPIGNLIGLAILINQFSRRTMTRWEALKEHLLGQNPPEEQ